MERLEEIADDLEHLDCVILYTEDQNQGSYDALPPTLTRTCQLARFEDLFSDISTDFEPAPQFSDLVGIMYTSGTTGVSKGVSTTHSHSFCYADGAAEIFYLSEEDRFCSSEKILFEDLPENFCCTGSGKFWSHSFKYFITEIIQSVS